MPTWRLKDRGNSRQVDSAFVVATMLKVKVYVIGLYLETKSGGAQAIIESSDNKRIAMQFVHDVTAKDLRGQKRSFKAAFKGSEPYSK